MLESLLLRFYSIQGQFQGVFGAKHDFGALILQPRFLEAEAKQPAKTMTLFLHTNVVVWEAREHCVDWQYLGRRSRGSSLIIVHSKEILDGRHTSQK